MNPWLTCGYLGSGAESIGWSGSNPAGAVRTAARLTPWARARAAMKVPSSRNAARTSSRRAPSSAGGRKSFLVSLPTTRQLERPHEAVLGDRRLPPRTRVSVLLGGQPVEDGAGGRGGSGVAMVTAEQFECLAGGGMRAAGQQADQPGQ